jgi:hypothetical protein
MAAAFPDSNTIAIGVQAVECMLVYFGYTNDDRRLAGRSGAFVDCLVLCSCCGVARYLRSCWFQTGTLLFLDIMIPL